MLANLPVRSLTWGSILIDQPLRLKLNMIGLSGTGRFPLTKVYSKKQHKKKIIATCNGNGTFLSLWWILQKSREDI